MSGGTRSDHRGTHSEHTADEITSIIAIDWDVPEAPWADSDTWTDTVDDAWTAPERDRLAPRVRPAEVTQDILIAEWEFGETVTAHPFENDVAQPWRPATTPQTTRPRTTRGGRHRLPAPPVALRGRAALVAVAAGAAVAAVATGHSDPRPAPAAPSAEPAARDIAPAAAVIPSDPAITGDSAVAQDATRADMGNFTDQLATGDKMAKDAAAADARSRLPLFASPLPLGTYQFTSGFAYRWGAFHGGIDFAAPLGTPIHAATDGVVIEAGPASGYGNWVQVRAADGTVTMYGHMASSGVNVVKGQQVTAGQIIAHVGSEGFSTGPHCHFEVWKNGAMKIDPAPWLAEHGVVLSSYLG